MDAEVSYRLKYGCFGPGRLGRRLMVVCSEISSVVCVSLQHFFVISYYFLAEVVKHDVGIVDI